MLENVGKAMALYSSFRMSKCTIFGSNLSALKFDADGHKISNVNSEVNEGMKSIYSRIFTKY